MVLSSEQSNFKITSYVGATATGIYNQSNRGYNQIFTGATTGVNLNNGLFNVNTEASVGNGVQAKLELGVTPSISKNDNLKFNCSTFVNATNNFISNDIKTSTNTLNFDINIHGQKYNQVIPVEEHVITVNPFHLDTGLKIGTIYDNDKVKVAFGCSAGVQTNYPKVHIVDDVTINISSKCNTEECDEQHNKTENFRVVNEVKNQSMYLTPYLDAEVNLGKKYSIAADATLYQGSVGIKYTF